MKKTEEGFYGGMKGKLKQEKADSAMISSGKKKHANLPTEAIIKDYPDQKGFLKETLDDTIKGIDKQISQDISKRSK